MKSLVFRIPAIVCSIVCFVALMASLRESKWWKLIFFACLPVCFFISAAIISKLHRDLSRLRRRVASLEAKVSGGHVRVERSHDPEEVHE